MDTTLLVSKSFSDVYRMIAFIAQHLPIDALKQQPVPRTTVCAFSGRELSPNTLAVRLKDIIKPATADIADTFRYPSDYLSISAAACFKANRELRGNLFITETGIIAPMVSGTSAKKAGRPTWLEIFQNWSNQNTSAVIILTEESKQRLWHKATLTEMGKTFQVYLNANGIKRNLTLDKSKLDASIAAIQPAMEAGYSKIAIQSSLYTCKSAVKANGLLTTRLLEREIASVRGLLEFQVASFIATVRE